MKHNSIADIVARLSDRTEDDSVEHLTKEHQAKAIEFYREFQQNFVHNLELDLKEIQNALNVELGRTIRKL